MFLILNRLQRYFLFGPLWGLPTIAQDFEAAYPQISPQQKSSLVSSQPHTNKTKPRSIRVPSKSSDELLCPKSQSVCRILSLVHLSFHRTHCRLPAEGISKNVMVNGGNFVIPGFDGSPFMDGTVPSGPTLNSLPLSSTVWLKRFGDETL